MVHRRVRRAIRNGNGQLNVNVDTVTFTSSYLHSYIALTRTSTQPLELADDISFRTIAINLISFQLIR